jgi:hypothetical protein
MLLTHLLKNGFIRPQHLLPTKHVVLPQHVYIDGECRQIVAVAGHGIHVDCPEMPGRACSEHYMTEAMARHLQAGASIRTSGHAYSFKPPKEI